MEEVRESYGAVCQIGRDARKSGYVTRGLLARMYAAIDALKTFKAPADEIRMAERISETRHALEWATRRRHDSRGAADGQARGTLEQRWLSAPEPTS